MIGRIQLLAGLTVLLGLSGLALGIANQSGPSVPFNVASVRFEQNATDGDAEVVFQVKGGKEGLAKLAVISPDGRTVIDFTAPDPSTLGIRQFHFETPEPRDIKSLKSAYPEGVYTFTGTTAAGGRLHGKSTLMHKLPATASVLEPRNGARGVSARDLRITWTPGKDPTAIVLTLKDRKLGFNLEARLPGSLGAFAVPEGFLRPAAEYQLAIGTVSAEGNISFVETTFTTGS